jgi:hypothetical protein
MSIRVPCALSRAFVAAALVAASLASAPSASAQVSPGNGTLILGTFPDKYWIIDEASGAVTGTIPFRSGIPRRTTLSRDRRRFYTVEAGMEKVEILDLATRKTIDTFTLSEGNSRVRVRALEPDPLHRFVMMVIKKTTKLVDRFEIGPSQLVQYDLATKAVVRTVPWPKGEERENANIQFSPDGKLMYLFSEQDVLIYETTGFNQTDRWELSKPYEEGVGALNFGSTDSVNDEPGFYTGLFTVQDPVQNRRIMGVGRVNLAAKSVDFYTLGPATQVNFIMAPGRKFAYGLASEIGRYEFWKFDLEKRRVAARHEFAGRPRMSLKVSTNGKVLYIWNAGNTIDLYDSETFAYIKTITLDGDFTSELFVMPAEPVTTTATTRP